MSSITGSSETKQEVKSLYDTIYQYTLTPYPAWIFSSCLLISPLVSPTHVIYNSWSAAISSRISPVSPIASSKQPKLLQVGPKPASVALFAAANLLGGYMTYDGDYINGAGFTSVWSALYLLVNGKYVGNAVRYAKPWPVLLAGLAMGNVIIYGQRFVWK